MTPKAIALFLATMLCLGLLQGCAAVAVGGAATGVAVIHDRRTTGTVLDDQTIELKAMQALSETPEIAEHSSISVTCYNYVVLLTGQAESSHLARRFADQVKNIDKVKRVINEVQAGPALSLAQQTQDSYLTAKVKTSLFDIEMEGFDPSRVKVVTHNDTVYLMGLVTHQEASAVVEKVRMIRGVSKVVRAFEYISA